MKRSASWLVVVASALVGVPAAAQDAPVENRPDDTHLAAAEQLRAELARQIHLQANELVDELVFGWIETPPFATPTPVVLADVVAPLGYGSGLEALIENHLAQLLIKNPGTNVQLAHCPSCNAVVVHSDATGTVIGRGVDQPEALQKLRGSSSADYALFLDFEGEGSTLVLRARMTQLSPALPIVYARTLSTRTSSTPLLRSPMRLVSADEAREEYLSILNERGPLTIPIRMALTGFAPGEDSSLQFPTPIYWLQGGAEYAISSARAWTGSLLVGATFLPTVVTGVMMQARAARLLTGSEVSFTHPNVYAFLGVSLALIQGQIAGLLLPPPPNPPPALYEVIGPVATYLSLQAGLEMRVSRRVGLGVLVEAMPTLYTSGNVGDYIDGILPGLGFGVLQANAITVEATFAF